MTGIETPCAWSVDTEAIPAQGSVTATAKVPLALGGADPTSALEDWLRSAGEATDAATSDAQVTSTAYPCSADVVQVKGPTRTVSGRTLKITLVPVWPNGPDELNPLLLSPARASRPRRWSRRRRRRGRAVHRRVLGRADVAKDGLVVQAQSVAQDCQIGARVGNFNNLTSEPFEITTRGS